MAAAAEVSNAVGRILSACLPPTSAQFVTEGARAQALSAYASPTGTLFSVPTQALSRVMKALKARAGGSAAKTEVEDAFMKLVTKVGPPSPDGLQLPRLTQVPRPAAHDPRTHRTTAA